MKLQIFDVEHGACSLLTADNGTRLMIDCGHNTSTGWKPGTYLREQNITTLDMLAITNYDEDHASGANDLFDNIDVRWLWRNRSVSGKTIKTLKSEDGMGPGIERLFKEAENNFTGNGSSSTEPVFSGLDTRKGFYNSYPAFDDENNLSMAVFLKCHGIGVMFTGDLEKAGFTELLKNDAFKQALRETNVYVASHHGRENGCSDEVAALLTNVYYVVISDKGYAYDTQKTLPFYKKIAKGGPFRSETRYVLTTRNDGRIGFEFASNSWGPY
jgi:beta-lactamase superfamily II metal-dependent hydrolase